MKIALLIQVLNIEHARTTRVVCQKRCTLVYHVCQLQHNWKYSATCGIRSAGTDAPLSITEDVRRSIRELLWRLVIRLFQEFVLGKCGILTSSAEEEIWCCAI